jgi:hypothetical protein
MSNQIIDPDTQGIIRQRRRNKGEKTVEQTSKSRRGSVQRAIPYSMMGDDDDCKWGFFG